MTPGIRGIDRQLMRVTPSESGYVVITGGAGFIGTNLAHRLLSEGRDVVIFDNLSRPGVELNVKWLQNAHGRRCRLVVGDVRDAIALRHVISDATQVFHFAAQVAVTTSLVDPLDDFEINARGTLNVLNAIRAQRRRIGLIFTSTNKVYGSLEDVELSEAEVRYEPVDERIRATGIGEGRPLDFHSPYGCSKGAADQYVSDFARSYGIPTAVFRMSCIYGPHQFGTEDQGWVAHFLIKALAREPLVLYGNGKQVRDVLFVDDLVDAFLLAEANIDLISGQAFNLGGGPLHTTSLLELLERIEQLTSGQVRHAFELPRVGDQRYYVSDTRRFAANTGWTPRVDVASGLTTLHEWLLDARVQAATGRSWRPSVAAAPVIREA